MTHVDDILQRLVQHDTDRRATTVETRDLVEAIQAVRERHKRTDKRLEFLVFNRTYWNYCWECRTPWPCPTLRDLAPVIGLIDSIPEALALLERSMRSEPEVWFPSVLMDNIDIDTDRIRETLPLFWVPLGRGTARYPVSADGQREQFVVVTRDGSSGGWRFTSKPGWWDDPAPRRQS